MIWGYAAPHTLGLLGANLQLAEDRIPSLLGVIYSGKHSDSPLTRFEFEAELTLEALVRQRRRWGNGSLAGLVYAVSHANAFLHRLMAFHSSCVTWGFSDCKPSATRSHSSRRLYLASFSVPHRAPWFRTFDSPRAASIQGLTSGSYALCGVTFVYVHVKRIDGDCVIQPSVLKLVVCYNAIMTLLIIAALVLDAVLYDGWGVLGAFVGLMSVPSSSPSYPAAVIAAMAAI